MFRVPTLCTVLLGLSVVTGSASAAHHEADEKDAAATAAWDQAAVAKLARDLQHASKRLRDLERAMPADSIASGQSQSRERYRDILRRLEAESRSLADRTEKGKSRDDTATLYGRIQELSRDAAENARRMFLSRETIDEIGKAEALMNQLRVYYKGAPEERPALVGPTKEGDGGAD